MPALKAEAKHWSDSKGPRKETPAQELRPANLGLGDVTFNGAGLITLPSSDR